MSGAKPQVGGRIPHDVHDDFEEYREELELSKSDALRRIVEAGLEEKQDEIEPGYWFWDVLAEYMWGVARFMTAFLILAAIIQFYTTFIPAVAVGVFAVVSLVWHALAIALQPPVRAELSRRFRIQEMQSNA
jgi:uncharacterized protein involved in cysteine biosynthesis